MMIIRFLVILILSVAIFGGAAYFSYELYWKPQMLDEEDRQAHVVQAAATPVDFSVRAYENAEKIRQGGDVAGATAALEDFLRQYPDSVRAPDARRTLGDINADRFFSVEAASDKIAYTVSKGDSLVRIASKFKTTPELIYRVNNMDSIALQVGQELTIPQPKIAIAVDHKASTLTVSNNGHFFKEYKLLSFKAPKPPPNASPKVIDKIAMQDTKRIAFGDKAYAESDRTLMVSGGIIIRGVPEGTKEVFPGGVVVSAPDMDEIFLLASRGTPVTIQ